MARSGFLLSLLAIGIGTLFSPSGGSSGETGGVLVLTVSGPITPTVAEYLELGLERGRESGDTLVIIELDTPGGLDSAMRSINLEILNSPIPVAVYVAPSGARAASAGAFITLAADVAAMAPGTNIGAAHPVQMMGKSDETMAGKIVNDAAAYIRSIAERRGRSGDWAEKFVRESASITETQALEENVIDLIAPDLPGLLSALEGREIPRPDGPITLRTEGRVVTRFPMDLRRRILDTLSNPNVAYLLLMLGFLGIFFELSQPGAIYPGVIGGIALILAFYSLQTLPVNYAGLLLLIVAVVLFIAEVQVTSYGLLSLGGIISLLMGSLMLFRSPYPWLQLSLKVVLPVVGLTSFFLLIVLRAVVKTHRRRPSTGLEGLVGEEGEALEELAPSGRVFVRGEIWETENSGEIKKGDRIKVTAVKGLKITVRKHGEGG